MKCHALAVLGIALGPLLKLIRRGVLLLLACSACDPGPPPEHVPAPRPSGLLGRWRYDSTGVATYNRRGQLREARREPLRPGAFLTVGARSWVFSGSVDEVHDYTRVGHVLRTRRLGTPRMVRLGYITPDQIGQPLFTKKGDIALLTPTRLIVRDSAGHLDPDCGPGDCFSVHKYYFSR
jgi:hypothetical protein